MHAGKLIFAQGMEFAVQITRGSRRKIMLRARSGLGWLRTSRQAVGPEPVFACDVTDPEHHSVRKSAAPSWLTEMASDEMAPQEPNQMNLF
jgi:hypothetical protein